MEILDDVIQPMEPPFTPDFARVVLNMRLSDTAQDRIRELLQRNNAGALTADERAVLDSYLLVG